MVATIPGEGSTDMPERQPAATPSTPSTACVHAHAIADIAQLLQVATARLVALVDPDDAGTPAGELLVHPDQRQFL